MTADRLDTLAANPEHLAGLRFIRNLQIYFTVQCRHGDGTTERGSNKGDRHGARQVGTVAFKNRMVRHADIDIKIARRATILTGLALAGQADAITIVDTRRYLDGERFAALDAAAATTLATGLLNFLAGAATTRAGLLEKKPCCLRT